MSTYVPKPLPKFYSTSRKLRNEAEKQRRCKLNHHVNQLAALVPFVTKAQKKVDKTSVLRLAASYLRLHNVLNKCQRTQGAFPRSFQGESAMRTLFNSIGGFLLVITTSGKVVYVSEAIEDTFNYSQTDIMGRSFFSLIHQDDIALIRHQLQPKEDDDRRSFYCRLLKNSSRSYSSSSRYEIIHVMGQLKAMEDSNFGPPCTNAITDSPSGLSHPMKESHKMKRTSSRASISYEEAVEDELPSGSHPGARKGQPFDSHILVALVEVVHDRPITELLWVESLRDEYVTRHKIDGSIAYVDHRISYVTGLMPEEVIGMSAFKFMHQDDMLWSLVAQKQMLSNPQGQGVVTYQLRCKDGQYVMLRSRGFLEVNKDTGKVDTFICINTVLSVTSGESDKRSQRKKLIPLLSGKSEDEIAQIIISDVPREGRMLVENLMQDKTNDMLQRMLLSISDYAETPQVSDSSLPSITGVPLNQVQHSVKNCQLGQPIPSTSTGLHLEEIPLDGTAKKRMKSDMSKFTKSSPFSVNEAASIEPEINKTSSIPGIANDDPSSFPVELFANSEVGGMGENNLYPTCSEIEQLMFTNTTLESPPNLLGGSQIGFSPTFSHSQPSSSHSQTSLSFSPESCIDFNALQPSYSQIENWGYPPVTAELSYAAPVPVPENVKVPPSNPQNLPLDEHVTSAAYFDTTSPSNSFPSSPKTSNYFCTPFYKPQSQDPHSSQQLPTLNHYQNEDRWPSRDRLGN